MQQQSMETKPMFQTL